MFKILNDFVTCEIFSKCYEVPIILYLTQNHGPKPPFFDLMGPHYVIIVQNCLGQDWYKALEYHWFALFNVILFVLTLGWNLQRADEQMEFTSKSSKKG